MSCPFTSIQCSIRYDNARILSWTLKPGADYPSDFILAVENSRAGGPWETLATGLTDSCFYIDTRKRNYNKNMNESYRVRLTSASTGENYVSEVCDAGAFKVYPFSAAAENVIKQVQQAIKISGVTGVLLKKKTWGVRCPYCTDFKDQPTVNEHCPYCLGVGIRGGYHNGISMDIIKDAIKCEDGPSLEGASQHEIVQARCIAYPWIHNGDVWVEDGTNKRYYIVDAEDSSNYKQTAIVYTITMHRIEYTDVLYSEQADSRVELKDLWDSAQVDYTPELQETLEKAVEPSWGSLSETM